MRRTTPLQYLSTAALLFASTTTSLIAQRTVSPSHFTATEASAAIDVPIASAPPTMQSPHRLMQIHDDLVGTPRTIRGMRFRRDGGSGWPAVPGYRVTVSVTLFEAAPGIGAATPDPVFANNIGTNSIAVLPLQGLSMPATDSFSAPEPFAFDLPFAAYPYSGNAPLGWDMVVTQSAMQAPVGFDAASGSDANPAAAKALIGSGCIIGTNVWPAGLDSQTFPSWGTTPPHLLFTYSAVQLARNTNGSIAFLAYGLDRRHPPLLIPGTACSVFLDPLGYLLVLVDPNGNFAGGSYSFLLPIAAAYNGTTLQAQAITLDPVTGLPASTNAASNNLVAPYGNVPVGSISAIGLPNSSGSPMPHFGAVVEFY